jgi:hypothetical protein
MYHTEKVHRKILVWRGGVVGVALFLLMEVLFWFFDEYNMSTLPTSFFV